MKITSTSPATRRDIARRAVTDLGADRDRHVRLRLRCADSHHLGVVYDTPAGPVYVARGGQRPHGSNDRHAAPHQAQQRATDYVDLVEPAPLADDTVPAWCGCGPHTVSRAALREALASHVKTLQLG